MCILYLAKFLWLLHHIYIYTSRPKLFVNKVTDCDLKQTFFEGGVQLYSRQTSLSPCPFQESIIA